MTIDQGKARAKLLKKDIKLLRGLVEARVRRMPMSRQQRAKHRIGSSGIATVPLLADLHWSSYVRLSNAGLVHRTDITADAEPFLAQIDAEEE